MQTYSWHIREEQTWVHGQGEEGSSAGFAGQHHELALAVGPSSLLLPPAGHSWMVESSFFRLRQRVQPSWALLSSTHEQAQRLGTRQQDTSSTEGGRAQGLLPGGPLHAGKKQSTAP